jgi:hypothetical protein
VEKGLKGGFIIYRKVGAKGGWESAKEKFQVLLNTLIQNIITIRKWKRFHRKHD